MGPGQGASGPAEWRDVVWAPCMDVGFRRPRALAQFCIAVALAKAQVLSEGTTFTWDTGGLRALLLALGGGVAELEGSLALLLGRDKGTPESSGTLPTSSPPPTDKQSLSPLICL